jgi:aspartyl-tRNA(Asn)/glutamyl-tRNA(Gln) amidotransferase subunit A
MNEELCRLQIPEAADLYRRRQLTPVEVTAAHLERIEALDPTYHAYITVNAEGALDAARTAESELLHDHDRGPLQGIPVAIKDLLDVKGLPTTAASGVLRGAGSATQDATAVAKLRLGGAIILGKLNLHEFAYGGPERETAFPPAVNPWDPTRTPGGSSSGSGVATALGLAMGTLGSDTGGSIRTPASHCGVVGLKPTFGRVSRAGCIPLAWSLDHIGPLARSVEDAAIILECIAGFDEADPWSAREPVARVREGLGIGIAGLRIGVPRAFFYDPEQTDSEVLSAAERALSLLSKLGATLVEVEVPHIHADYAAGAIILFADAFTYHEGNLRGSPELYRRGLRNRLRSGAFITARDYVRAYRVRALLKQQFEHVLRRVDVLVTPTEPRPAVPLYAQAGTAVERTGPVILRPFSMAGLPAVSVPCGFSAEGLPLGLHISGRPFDEATILRVAYAYEQATDWHRRHPEVVSSGPTG